MTENNNNNSEKLYGLIGSPLGHSISPQIHQRLFSLRNINASYKLFPIEREKLEAEISFLNTLDGFNITIPHKRSIIPFLSDISLRAIRCGAVNTVLNKNSRMSGFNTDADGFLRTLSSERIELCGSVLLLGSGGVARMMACCALEKGCILTVADRHIEKANSLKDDFKKLFSKAEINATELSSVKGSFDLILNGTPVGMFPNTDALPIDIGTIKSSKAVFDAIGNPIETKLVNVARSFGIKAVGGLKMLVLQAVAAHEIWDSSTYTEKEIDDLYNEMCVLTVTNFHK